MELSDLIEKIGQQLMQIKFAELEKIQCANVNLSLYQYIYAIGELDHPVFSELADKLNLSKPAVTASVNKLIQQGIVKKQQSDEDKRLFYLSLTPKGMEVFNICKMANKKVEEQIKNKLSKNEWDELIDILTKIVQ